jgi:hypothetical protein
MWLNHYLQGVSKDGDQVPSKKLHKWTWSQEPYSDIFKTGTFGRKCYNVQYHIISYENNQKSCTRKYYNRKTAALDLWAKIHCTLWHLLKSTRTNTDTCIHYPNNTYVSPFWFKLAWKTRNTVKLHHKKLCHFSNILLFLKNLQPQLISSPLSIYYIYKS